MSEFDLIQSQLAPIGVFKENPDNPREIDEESFEKLKSNIKSFTRMLSLRPLVVDKNMVVLGGNMRLKACQSLGFKELPYLLDSDLTEDEKKQFIILDNVAFGKWDWDDLANKWDSKVLNNWGLDVWQMPSEEDLSELFIAQDDSEPEKPKDSAATLFFHFSKEDAITVKKALLEHGPDLEKALWNLLFN